jgi:hypothetical protein
MTVLIKLVMGSSVVGLGAQLLGLRVAGGGLALETALVGRVFISRRGRLSRDGRGIGLAQRD